MEEDKVKYRECQVKGCDYREDAKSTNVHYVGNLFTCEKHYNDSLFESKDLEFK